MQAEPLRPTAFNDAGHTSLNIHPSDIGLHVQTNGQRYQTPNGVTSPGPSTEPARSLRGASETALSPMSGISTDAGSSSGLRAGSKRKRLPPFVTPERICANCHSHARDRDEGLLVCTQCQRAGHPTCFQLANIMDRVRPYQTKWKCVDCKACEVCGINDEHVLLCDSCDRAWHPYCLTPPLDELPDGIWACPLCPQPEPEEDQEEEEQDGDFDPDMTLRQASEHEEEGDNDDAYEEDIRVSSRRTSRSRRASRSTRSRSIRTDEDEEEAVIEALEDPDATESEEDLPMSSAPDAPPRSARRGSNRQRTSKARPDRKPEPARRRSSAVTPRKRPPMKLKLKTQLSSAPVQANVPVAPPPKTRLTLKLRVPAGMRGDEGGGSDDLGRNPYEEVLAREEADTAQTSIMREDKQRFERARLQAEARLPPPLPSTTLPSTPGAGPGPSTLASRSSLGGALETPISGAFALGRPLRSQSHIFNTSLWDRPAALPQTPLTPGTPLGRPGSPFATVAPPSDALRIKQIRFGGFDIDTWYDAPFPEEYSNLPEGRLWMCEFCLKYMKSEFSSRRHAMKCKARHPPGDEIYRDGTISVFEVDGRRNKIYCQNLCLLSKMFLHQKSLFYDVEPFLFYVMTETAFDSDTGTHFVGYFSKEKSSPKGYNLSCIMTLPIHQRKGFGQFLIDFSFLLSRKECRAGTPERPLSSLGALSYKNYWLLAIMRYLHTRQSSEGLAIEEICTATAITREDIYTTLRDNGILTLKVAAPASVDGDVAPPTPTKASRRKRGRPTGGRRTTSRTSGRPSVAIESRVGSEGPGSPFAKSPRASFDTTASGPKTSDADKEDEENVIVPHSSHYTISWEAEAISEKLDKWAAKGYLIIRPENLEWSPYLLSRSGDDVEMSGRPGEMLGTEMPTHSLVVPTPTTAQPAKGKMPLGPSKLSKVVTLPAATSLMPPIKIASNNNSAGALGDFATLALAHEKQSQEQADHALAAQLAEEERAAMDALSSPRRTRSAASVTPSGLGYVAGPSTTEQQGSPTPAMPSLRKRVRPSRARESAGAVSVPSGWAAAEEEGQEDEEGTRARRAKRARTSMAGSSAPTGMVEEPLLPKRRSRAPRAATLAANGRTDSIDVDFPPIQSASSSRRNRKRASAAAATTTPDEGTALAHDGELDAVPPLRRSSEPLGTSADSTTAETQTPPSGEADVDHPVVIVAADQQLSGPPFILPAAEKRAAVVLHGASANVRVGVGVIGDLNDEEDEDAEGEDDPDA